VAVSQEKLRTAAISKAFQLPPIGVIEMRWIALIFLLAVFVMPSAATGQETVAQLEQAVAAAHGKPDKEIAERIAGFELTERLSAARLELLKACLPGERSRMGLLAVADASEFLNLPAADIPAAPAPDRATQDALLAKAVDYVGKTITMLPDIFATRETIFFANGPEKASRFSSDRIVDPKLHVVNTSSATVRFLAGREELVDERAESGKLLPVRMNLATAGVFGTIFGIVLKDAFGGKPPWSHWEQGRGGPMAVFRFDVPEERSHYSALVPGDPGFLKTITAYHGEIALDPADGSILRLTLIAAPRPNGPVARADIMIEYGPVTIGGKSYICPLRSVAISLARRLNLMQDVYGIRQEGQSPLQLQVNDVVFRQYHLFRTEMRLLP
jgi:hypothetical protein